MECKFYARGNCKFGDRCKFRHSNNDRNSPKLSSFGSFARNQNQNRSFGSQNSKRSTSFGFGSAQGNTRQNQMSNNF